MKKRINKILRLSSFVLPVMFLLSGCMTSMVSILTSCDYNKKTDKTEYMYFPFGSVSIPGKWEQTSFNSQSKQQFFQNADSIEIAVCFGPCTAYEFNHDNSKKGFDFVKAYYEWEADYFVNTLHVNQEKIETNESERYIIWRAFGEYNNAIGDHYFLVGENKGRMCSFDILITDKWTREHKIAFLKAMYYNSLYK